MGGIAEGENWQWQCPWQLALVFGMHVPVLSHASTSSNQYILYWESESHAQRKSSFIGQLQLEGFEF